MHLRVHLSWIIIVAPPSDIAISHVPGAGVTGNGAAALGIIEAVIARFFTGGEQSLAMLPDMILDLSARHGEGIGIGAAEARPKESEQVAPQRADAANKTDLKRFMRKSLCFRAWSPGDRRTRSSLRAPGAFSRKGDHCQWRLSALLRLARERKTFRDIVGDQEGSDRVASHRELPSSSARPQEKRITRA
jgi:hypothetical protein